MTALITTSEISAVIGRWYKIEYRALTGMLADDTIRK
jgi:hypothetical protein